MNEKSLNKIEKLTNPVSRILEIMKVPIGILFANESDPESVKAIFTMREVAKTSNLIHFVYSSSDVL